VVCAGNRQDDYGLAGGAGEIDVNAVLIRAGHIFDGSPTLLPAHAVLVEDGRVRSLDRSAAFEGWAGDTIDLPGTTLLPGLIDCHVHLTYRAEPNLATTLFVMSPEAIALRTLESARETLLGGVTAVRDCGGKDFIEFAVRDACNTGRFLGPWIQVAGQFICMSGGHGWQVARIADGVEEVRKAVREQLAKGADLVKLMATGGVMTAGADPRAAHYTLEELTAGVGEATRRGKRSASHAMGGEGILNAVRAGITSIEHGIFMDDECVRAMIERKTYLVPTIATMLHVVQNAERGIPAFAVEKARMVLEAQRTTFRTYCEAGGLVAMGTDAGTPYTAHGDNCVELRYMVEFGLSRLQSLIAATRNGADLMGLPDRGRIEPGCVADFLAVCGNPLADIDAVADRSRHHAVIKAGSIVHARPKGHA